MGHISSGILTDEISIGSKDEFGQLMSGLNYMQSKLKNMINDINIATGQIEVFANNLEESSQESSRRVATQQQRAHQLVDDVNQLNQASIDVSDGASDSADEIKKAEAEVNKGRGVIVQGVETIRNISDQVNQAESSVKDVNTEAENIGAVLDVIIGIAEQTNLLALNAAIEAGSNDNSTCQIVKVSSLPLADNTELYHEAAELSFPPPLSKGDIIDGYQILNQISSGGMGTLYAARKIKADFRVCLTGTPVENDLAEFYNILDLAVP